MTTFLLVVTLLLPQGGVEVHRVPLASQASCREMARLIVRLNRDLVLIEEGAQRPIARSSVECVQAR